MIFPTLEDAINHAVEHGLCIDNWTIVKTTAG
jgi:hypothetical protein